MLSQRFWSFSSVAVSFALLAAVTLLGGCNPPASESAAEKPVQIPQPPAQPGQADPGRSPAEEQTDPLPPDSPLPASSETMPAAPVEFVLPEPELPPAVPPGMEEQPPATTPAVSQPAPSPPPLTGNPLRGGIDQFPSNRDVTGAEPVAPAAPPTEVPVATTPSTGPSTPSTTLTTIPSTTPLTSSGQGFAGGKHGGEEFDPVAENGAIFVGWAKPKLALVISGRQDGYLEPCGCAGLDRMKGGLTRRHALFQQLAADGWPLIGLDCGGLIKGFGRQAELKFGMSVDAMQTMGYDAIALGKSDLRLPATELLARVATTPDVTSLFLSANVAVFGFDLGMTADHRIVEAGGMRVGMTSVLGMKWMKEINNPEIEMVTPEVKLREVLPKMQGKCDLLVLLAHATMEESKALAASFPQFDIVVTADGPPEPPAAAEMLPGNTMLVEVGEKGMNAVVLGIFDEEPPRYQRVPLDSRFEDSPDMKMFMKQYQDQLRRDGLAKLGIRPVPHPRVEELGKFVGSKQCMICHEPSWDVWRKTGHAKAWDTLKELEVPRAFDPECISCHVVGWHPTEHFPYESGFLSEEETPKLIDVGCENCHGPGEKHVAAEMGADEELQIRLRKAMIVTKEQTKSDKVHWCLNCHDLDNSPDFNFDEYWPKVEHSEDE